MIVILRTSPGGMRSCSSFMLESTILPFAALYTRTCGWRRLGGFECCQAGSAEHLSLVHEGVAHSLSPYPVVLLLCVKNCGGCRRKLMSGRSHKPCFKRGFLI